MWTAEELEKFMQADDLKIAPLRSDGVTHGTPTWIWAVTLEGSLYVRPYSGPRSSWYQAALKMKAGLITVAGGNYPVRFTAVDGSLNDLVDAAYREKYSHSRYLQHMITGGSRISTVRIDRVS
jgi:hypothetical protein